MTAWPFRVRNWDCVEQGLTVRVKRGLVQFECRCELYDSAQVHDRDPIADMFDDRQIVRDENIGQGKFLLQVAKQVDDLSLNGQVKG